TNQTGRRRDLSVTYYAEWVLGGTREQTGQYVVTDVDVTSGALFARNSYRFDFGDRIAFADVLQRPRTVTGDRSEFLGRNRSPAPVWILARPCKCGSTWTPGPSARSSSSWARRPIQSRPAPCSSAIASQGGSTMLWRPSVNSGMGSVVPFRSARPSPLWT